MFSTAVKLAAVRSVVVLTFVFAHNHVNNEGKKGSK